MKIIEFKNNSKESYFAPEYFYQMVENELNSEKFDYSFEEIAKIILKKEIELKEKYPYEKIEKLIDKPNLDGYTNLGDSLTARYHFFNVFHWQEKDIQNLKKDIFYAYCHYMEYLKYKRPKIWIRAWANVMRKGQKMSVHMHSTNEHSYLGGHVSVQCENTSTFYVNPIDQINDVIVYEALNEIGKVAMFQQNIPHYTSVHTGDKERITIAFDLITDTQYKIFDKHQKMNLVLFDEGEL
jgi:hypothetical protein